MILSLSRYPLRDLLPIICVALRCVALRTSERASDHLDVDDWAYFGGQPQECMKCKRQV